MAEYIERETVLKKLNEIGGCSATDEWSKGYDSAIDAAVSIIEDMPTADVQPVEHGRWIPQYVSSRGLADIFSCSVCNGSAFTSHKYSSCPYKYCNHCGARMDGGEKNEKA